MTRLRMLALFVLCVFPAVCAAAPEAENPLGADPALDRKLLVSAEGVPLGELLATVSKKTGIAIRADGVAADDKVIVFGPARPLKATLTAIASLYNDTWRHYVNVEGKQQYVLYRDPRALRYEAALAAAQTARMEARLQEQVRALDETPEQFAKRPETDWIRRNFAESILHGRTATRLYGLLDARQREALFAQGYLNVSFIGSDPAARETAQDAFKEAVAGLVKENERVQQQDPNVHIVIDSPENLERSGVRFNLHHENNAGLSALVVQVILGKASYMTMGAFDSEAQWMLPPHGRPYNDRGAQPELTPPDAKESSTAAKARSWIEVLRALSQTTGRPIVADYYRTPALVKPLTEAAEPGVEPRIAGLDLLCQPAGYLWWTEGETLLFRKRDWFRQMLYEVPDRWIRAVALKLKQQKTVPNYGDVAALLTLTQNQVAGLNNLLGGGGGTPYDSDTLAGLPDLLAMLNDCADPAASVYTGSLEPDVVPVIALPSRGVSPALRGPVAGFLLARRQIAAPADIARFRVCITSYGPAPPDKQDASSPDPRGKVTLVIEWNPGEGQTPFDHRLQMYLPTELPDDRSGKTRVESVP